MNDKEEVMEYNQWDILFDQYELKNEYIEEDNKWSDFGLI